MTAGILVQGERELTILSGLFSFPRCGAWTARVELDADEDEPVEPGDIRIILSADNDGEPIELAGTIQNVDTSTHEGRATAFIVAGRGMLTAATLPARTYQQAPFPVFVAAIATDAVEESGEEFDDDVALATITVSRWHRVAMTAAQLLDRLAERWGVVWRFNDEGRVMFSIDAFDVADEDDAKLLLEQEDAHDRAIHGTVGRASIRPGSSVRGYRIDEVHYMLDSTTLRVMLKWGDGIGVGGLRGEFKAAVANAEAPRAYRELHRAVVRRQNADGSIDVDAENEAIGGITAVPYRPGIVNCRLVYQEGDNVLIGFDGGNEDKPFAISHETLVGEGVAVARVGDAVQVGSILFAATADVNGGIGSITITVTPHGGTPTVAGTLTPASPVEIGLSGSITTGSSEVFIRGNT